MGLFNDPSMKSRRYMYTSKPRKSVLLGANIWSAGRRTQTRLADDSAALKLLLHHEPGLGVPWRFSVHSDRFNRRGSKAGPELRQTPRRKSQPRSSRLSPGSPRLSSPPVPVRCRVAAAITLLQSSKALRLGFRQPWAACLRRTAERFRRSEIMNTGCSFPRAEGFQARAEK